MAKLKNLPALAIINGFKGKIDFYVHRGINCARKWPRSPGRKRAPAVEAQWSTFRYATKAWVYLSPEVQDAYRQNARGTSLSGRDLFIKGYITGYIKLI